RRDRFCRQSPAPVLPSLQSIPAASVRRVTLALDNRSQSGAGSPPPAPIPVAPCSATIPVLRSRRRPREPHDERVQSPSGPRGSESSLRAPSRRSRIVSFQVSYGPPVLNPPPSAA